MTSTAHSLPIELIERICILAAEQDWKTAHALGRVSRSTCQWTAKARWKTVVLTSWRQCVAFWRTVCGIDDEIAAPFFALADHVARFEAKVIGGAEDAVDSSQLVEASDAISQDARLTQCFESLETRYNAKFGRHRRNSDDESDTDIDKSDSEDDKSDEDDSKSDSGSNGTGPGDLTPAQLSLRRALAFAVVLFAETEERAFEQVSLFSLPGSRPHIHIENLFVDVGGSGKKFMNWLERTSDYDFDIFGEMFPGEVDDPRVLPWTLLDIWNRSSAPRPRIVSLGFLHNNYAPVDYGMVLSQGQRQTEEVTVVKEDVLGGDAASAHIFCPSTTKRLHIVGLNPSSEYVGLSPPWQHIEYLTEPGFEGYDNRIINRTAITHLRYDTRRFSLKPAEITAHRMKGLLREIALVTPHASVHDVNTQINDRDRFRHDGAPHAAPSQGAGNRTMLASKESSLIPAIHQSDDNIFAKHLKDIGVGRLRLVHLAWASAESSGDKQARSPQLSDAQDKNAKGPTFEETGGWPREVRGAWTERSERVDQHAEFATELRDAIAMLYGWDAGNVVPAAKYCADRDRYEQTHGSDAEPYPPNTAYVRESQGMMVREQPLDAASQEILQFYDDRLKSKQEGLRQWIAEGRAACEAAGTTFDPDRLAVNFGFRAPKSLVHLGGPAALRVEDRLRLFEERARGGKGAWP